MTSPQQMACNRCALDGDLRDAESITQAGKRGYITQSGYHEWGDCLRRLRDAINVLQREAARG